MIRPKKLDSITLWNNRFSQLFLFDNSPACNDVQYDLRNNSYHKECTYIKPSPFRSPKKHTCCSIVEPCIFSKLSISPLIINKCSRQEISALFEFFSNVVIFRPMDRWSSGNIAFVQDYDMTHTIDTTALLIRLFEYAFQQPFEEISHIRSDSYGILLQVGR